MCGVMDTRIVLYALLTRGLATRYDALIALQLFNARIGNLFF